MLLYIYISIYYNFYTIFTKQILNWGIQFTYEKSQHGN